MDSLTQIVLGAAVGESMLGKKIGRKASLYGALLGTLPDLDVLWVKNAVDSFTEHRSFSHSLIILLLVSPVFAWLLKRLHPNEMTASQRSITFSYYCFSVYLIFATHALLDWCTVYGTQLLWPITDYPFGLANIFIVDPLYTLPFLLCLLITIVWRKRQVLFFGLTLSCSYLLWGLFAQYVQNGYFETALQQRGIDTDNSLTLPMPLNTLLWKNITMTSEGYWVSYRSIFDAKEAPIQTQFFHSENHKLSQIANTEAVKKLKVFTKGYYQVRELDDGVWLSDLRMGGFGNFVFNFRVGERIDQQTIAAPDDVVAKTMRGDKQKLTEALERMKMRITKPETELFDLFDQSIMVQKASPKTANLSQ